MDELYNVLEINKFSSKEDIKRAYRKLALKYHPDKNTDIGSKEKFIKIHTSYQILMNNHNNTTNNTLCDIIKKHINNIYPELPHFCEHIINIFYQDKTELHNDITNCNIINIYNKIIDSLNNSNKQNNCSDTKMFDNNRDSSFNDYIDLNIYTSIETTIKDKYFERYANVTIKRFTLPDYNGLIPLNETSVIIENEGETTGINIGNIIIDINVIHDDTYTIIDNNITMDCLINLHQYLYGGKIKIKYFDDNITINFDSFINKIPIIKIQNKGILINNIKGDLIINFKINNIDKFEKIIHELSW